MIRVLLADDSATVRRHLSTLLTSSGEFEVVGQVASGEEIPALVQRLRPDVVSLDVFMPGNSAARTVRELLAVAPVPVVLVSDAPRDAAEVFEALAAGALDFVRKPSPSAPQSGARMLDTLRVLSRVKVRRRPIPGTAENAGPVRLVAIGSSAGGPGALRELLSALPEGFAATVVVAQHLTEGFEEGFAAWLQQVCRLKVRLATDGAPIVPGEVVLGRPAHDVRIGPGRLQSRPAQSGFHPSVDELFVSAAEQFGPRALGVVLSGIGSDGARGAQRLADAGATVLAQSSVSAAIDGMPGAVRRLGLASIAGTPAVLASAIVDLVSARRSHQVTQQQIQERKDEAHNPRRR